MAGNAGGNQRIIPLEEGWNDEIKAKVSERINKTIIQIIEYHSVRHSNQIKNGNETSCEFFTIEITIMFPPTEIE